MTVASTQGRPRLELAGGMTIRSVRRPVGPGEEGKIFTIVLSPDGKWRATGGWITVPGQLGHVIRLA
jgi:hypothetical protein